MLHVFFLNDKGTLCDSACAHIPHCYLFPDVKVFCDDDKKLSIYLNPAVQYSISRFSAGYRGF
jgi:hypothetical protein